VFAEEKKNWVVSDTPSVPCGGYIFDAKKLLQNVKYSDEIR